MRHFLMFMLIGVGGLMALAPAAQAQAAEWSPPSTSMPMMPRMADLQADWRSSVGAWLDGIGQVTDASGPLRAMGDAAPGSDRAQFVRFTSGPLPVVLWTDRNGDQRADMIELYRKGTVVNQLLDADYDGSADVMRIYDTSGTFVRERRM